jgi:hypothetical protein
MRAIFVLSSACALMSLFAFFGLSAMSVVPGSPADRHLPITMLAIAVIFVVWLCVGFWALARYRAEQPLPPRWLRGLLLGLSILYLLGVFFLLIAVP